MCLILDGKDLSDRNVRDERNPYTRRGCDGEAVVGHSNVTQTKNSRRRDAPQSHRVRFDFEY